MIILPGNRTPTAIYYGNRPVRSVYVGAKLVWPEAERYGIRSISLCKTHAAFVLNDGTLWTTGSNLHGQLCRTGASGSWNAPNLAPVPGVTDAKAVVTSNTVTGEGTTVVLRDHGRVWSAGYSTGPTLSVTATEPRAYTSLGRSGISGSPTFCNFAEVLGLSDIRKLWLGRGRLLVQRGNGAVYGYGLDWNANRVLFQWMQVADTNGLPLACSEMTLQCQSFVALHADGSVAVHGPIAGWSRPAEFYPQYTAVLEPVPTATFLTGIRKVTAGLSHLAAVTRTGQLHVAGSDQYGQLGSRKFAFRNPQRGHLLDGEPVADVACGDNHTVILCRDGRVKTAGRNHRGQLGRAVPVGNGHDWLFCTGSDRVTQEGWFGNAGFIPEIDDAVAIHAGGDGTMIIRKSGITVCGDNEFGQLGTATERHIVNGGDRPSWRESWQGTRTPFTTNLSNANLFDSF